MKKLKMQSRKMVALVCALVLCLVTSMMPVSAEDVLEAVMPTSGNDVVIADEVTISFSTDEVTFPFDEGEETGIAAFSLRNVSFQECFGDQLDDLAKEIYDVMVKNYVTEGKSGEVTASFNNPFTFEAEIDNDGESSSIVENEAYTAAGNQISAAYKSAYQSFVKDYPEAFWISSLPINWKIGAKTDSSSSTGWTGTITDYTLTAEEYSYAGVAQTGTFNNGITAAKAVVEAELGEGASRYEILKAIHDYLCEELAYNYDAVSPGGDEYQYAHNVYTVFAGNKQVVCEGYAKAFKVLADEFGIPCILVTGNGVTSTGSEAHMWNNVKMEDGNWYGVDVTWDDQSEIRYDYFLAGAKTAGFVTTFSQEHQQDTTFVYPELAEAQYEYDPAKIELLKGQAAAEEALSDFTAANDTTEAAIVAAVKEAVGSDFGVTMADFSKQNATTEAAGSITGIITLAYDGKTIDVSVSLSIAKLNSTPETPEEPGTETPGEGTETPEEPGTETPGEGTETPENPGTTETPEEPGETETPENPGETETPEEPGETETPENPGETETPEEPGTETPENPGETETPEEPGTETPGEGSTEGSGDETPGEGSTGTETPGEGSTGTETPGEGSTGTETPGEGSTEGSGDEIPGEGSTGTETPGEGSTDKPGTSGTGSTETPVSSGSVTNTTGKQDNAQNASLEESGTKLAKAVLTADEQERVENGEHVDIWLEVSEYHATEEEQALTEEKVKELGDNYKVGMYLDLNLWKQFENMPAVKVENTNDRITLKFEVPEELVNKDSSKDRTYQIIRIHDGVAEALKADYDAKTNTVSFQTDRFSVYALVYVDTEKGTVAEGADNSSRDADAQKTYEKVEAPATGDMGNVSEWILLVLIGALGVITLGKRDFI